MKKEDEELEVELGEKPIIKIYVNGELAFVCGQVKGEIEIFRPDENCAIRVRYLSDEEWEEINCEDEDLENA